MMEFDLEYTLGLFPILLKYLGTTMEMALWGFVLALVLSLILAIVRVFRVPAIHWLAMLYISFFRGTPLLVQLFLLYYGLPQLFPIFVGMDAFTAAIIGLTLHFAAYMAESIRAAILGIHKSQMSRVVSGLARRKLVVRDANSEDARGVHLRLSRSGGKLYAGLIEAAAQRDRAFRGCLTREEKQAFERALAKLAGQARAFIQQEKK